MLYGMTGRKKDCHSVVPTSCHPVMLTLMSSRSDPIRDLISSRPIETIIYIGLTFDKR
ncbi:protein of unknown function [Mesotoga infera]|uniref:Uncharacterized protein n=1 Tax=Mesotoga infera TaxID=1236046 RepID=A0A7Z7LGI8_9BACT|nr:protein of unknown function [Mesotoga infera]